MGIDDSALQRLRACADRRNTGPSPVAALLNGQTVLLVESQREYLRNLAGATARVWHAVPDGLNSGAVEERRLHLVTSLRLVAVMVHSLDPTVKLPDQAAIDLAAGAHPMFASHDPVGSAIVTCQPRGLDSARFTAAVWEMVQVGAQARRWQQEARELGLAHPCAAWWHAQRCLIAAVEVVSDNPFAVRLVDELVDQADPIGWQPDGGVDGSAESQAAAR